MTRCFVDTNVFLRFLTNDVPEQAERAATLFRDASAGKIVLMTSVLVLAEIVWTLESYYGLPKGGVAGKVLAILNTPGLVVENAALLAEAATVYTTANVDFVDAYNACRMQEQGIACAYTFASTSHGWKALPLSTLAPSRMRPTRSGRACSGRPL